MKISFYISSLSGGGAEKVLTCLANRLALQGNEVHVISLEKRPQFYTLNDNVILHKAEYKKGKKFIEQINDFLFIKKYFRKIKADISISFLTRCNILVLLTNLLSKEKIIVCDRNNPLKEHSKKIFTLSNIIYKRANKIIVQTKQIKSFYDRRLQDKIDIIENPIDDVALYKQIENKEIKKENTIISIGRLEPQKDFETLIKAFAKIHYKYPDWKVKIFGIGDMQKQLENLAIKCNVKDSVIFSGRTETPFYELKKSKIFVLSTHYEGFPNALCEAMEAGLICIASDCVSGPNELIQNGINGWLFPVGDDIKLSELLIESIDSVEDIKMGICAAKTTKRLYLEENIKYWKKAIGSVL